MRKDEIRLLVVFSLAFPVVLYVALRLTGPAWEDKGEDCPYEEWPVLTGGGHP